MVSKEKTKLRELWREILIITIIIVIIITSVCLFISSRSTYYKYNDWWIIGRSVEEVETRYGEFDIIFGNRVGYYLYTHNGPIMADYLPRYYYMKFDENNIIYEVFKGVHPGG